MNAIRIIRRARQLLRACSCPACAEALALLDWALGER
jgi:hypothetical protein